MTELKRLGAGDKPSISGAHLLADNQPEIVVQAEWVSMDMPPPIAVFC